MKIYILFIFSQALWANTLVETQTAVGIANSLQGKVQGNPTKILNQVKGTVNNYKQVQEQNIQTAEGFPPEPNSVPSNNPVSAQQREPQSLPANNPVSAQQREPQSLPANNPVSAQQSEPQSFPANNPVSAQQSEPQSFPANNPVLDQMRLSDQEQNQIQELDYSSPPPASLPSSSDSFNNNSVDASFIASDKGFQGRDMFKETQEEVPEEYFKQERIIEVEEKPIDYKAKTQIFYKKDCLPSQSNCQRRGAVFTNIRSVIFDYAHSRGSFSEDEKDE